MNDESGETSHSSTKELSEKQSWYMFFRGFRREGNREDRESLGTGSQMPCRVLGRCKEPWKMLGRLLKEEEEKRRGTSNYDCSVRDASGCSCVVIIRK